MSSLLSCRALLNVCPIIMKRVLYIWYNNNKQNNYNNLKSSKNMFLDHSDFQKIHSPLGKLKINICLPACQNKDSDNWANGFQNPCIINKSSK